jgi:hypothetical protein
MRTVARAGLNRREFMRFTALGVVGAGCSAFSSKTSNAVPSETVTAATFVPVSVEEVLESPRDDYGIIVLKDANDRYLPIWVGRFEAQSIRIGLNRIATPRPMTYDFVRNLFDATNAKPTRVQITQLREMTFFATLDFDLNGVSRSLDCRPSDAIAVAVRTGTPVFVDEQVMASQSVTEEMLERIEPPTWA